MHDIGDTCATLGDRKRQQETSTEIVALVGASEAQKEASASTATSASLANPVSEPNIEKPLIDFSLGTSIVERKQKVYVKESEPYYAPSYGAGYDAGYGGGGYGDGYGDSYR